MLRRFAALAPRERRLVAGALGWVLAARAVLRLGGPSFPRQQRLLDRLVGFLPTPPRCTVEEASWAITAVAARVPGTRCLAWALALRGLLTQGGISSELCIGVAASEPGTIKAHAWVESAGRRWSWGGDVDGYQVLRPRAVAR
jgi:hypothetical protein